MAAITTGPTKLIKIGSWIYPKRSMIVQMTWYIPVPEDLLVDGVTVGPQVTHNGSPMPTFFYRPSGRLMDPFLPNLTVARHMTLISWRNVEGEY